MMPSALTVPVAVPIHIPPLNRPVASEPLWPSPGQWTYEDYLRLPDDGKRYEIIEGVLYVSNAPSYDHQFTVSKLLMQIGSFVEQRRLGVVLTALFEVHLPKIAQPVQPDILFIAKERLSETQEFSLYGQFGPGEMLQSVVLPELVLAVESLFVGRGTE